MPTNIRERFEIFIRRGDRIDPEPVSIRYNWTDAQTELHRRAQQAEPGTEAILIPIAERVIVPPRRRR